MTGIQPVDAVIRVAALDGTWETVGADRLAGIAPENVSLTANPWGSDKASFDLRRDPGGVYPDLSAFTPVDIEVGGTKVWSGRVSSTPSRDGSDSVVNVQCEGWQYHLDDDAYERAYVHAKLSDYVDTRTLPGASLGRLRANGRVQQDNGLLIGFGADSTVNGVGNNDVVAVTLDLGPYSLAKRAVVTWSAVNPNASFTATIRAHNTIADLLTYSGFADAVSVGHNTISTSATTSAGTFATAYRYVTVFLARTDGASSVTTIDTSVLIQSLVIFADTAYESGNASILKASDVVSDALGRGTIFLTDTAGVTATSFSLPEYAPDGLRTPREHINAVNAYHAWRAQVTVDRRFIFQAQPAAPLFEAGEWSGCEIADASMNDGDEIYSRCVVEANGPDGIMLRTERTQGQQTGVWLQSVTSPAPDNPSFAVNTTSWTASGSAITRDTGTFDTSPASGRWDNTGASDALNNGDAIETTFTGTFFAGVPYILRFALRASAGVPYVFYNFGVPGVDAQGDGVNPTVGSFLSVSISWTPSSNRTGVKLQMTTGGGAYIWIDSLALFSAQPTLVDRRGFKRTKILPVQSAMTTAAAQQIADTYLSLHRTTPYRGSITVTPGGIRGHQTGQPVHPATLLTQTQEKIRLTHRINPDDGSVGRDGTIAAVTYDHDAQTASIDLDNRTTNFEAFLSRLSLLTGQVR